MDHLEYVEGILKGLIEYNDVTPKELLVALKNIGENENCKSTFTVYNDKYFDGLNMSIESLLEKMSNKP